MMRKYVSNARIIALAVALLVVSGLGALKNLPRSEDPRISNRFAFIFTPFPGASPERVESLVTEKVENKLRELPEIKTIVSRSLNGLSSVIIELKDDVYEEDTALIWSRARDLLTEVSPQLPAGAGNPRLDDNRTYAYTMIVALKWEDGDNSDIPILNRYADELESRLRAIPGTDFVGIHGSVEEEITIEVDPLIAASTSTSLEQLSGAIASADSKISAGLLNNEQNQLGVEVSGELDSLDRIRRIPVSSDGLGNILYVGDIADVKRALKTPASNVVLVDGKQAVVLAIRMLPDLRVDQWTTSIENEIEHFSDILPVTISHEIIFNQAGYTEHRLMELTDNILLGFALIIIVLFVTLGLRSALIVATALPLTMFFTLTCMQYYGLPIHQMSVTGLIVALGIMVDNAIVMVDSIAQQREAGNSRVDSMVRSIRHLWIPLLGSTLTTILGFLPIVLMPGPSGEFVGGIALTVIFSLIGSYFISLTIIAGLAGRLLPKKGAQKTHWYYQGIKAKPLSIAFEKTLRKALKRPWLTIAVIALIPFAGFKAVTGLTEQFFPAADRDMFSIELHMSQQSSIDATLSVTKAINHEIAATKGVKSIHWFVGASAPPFYYNLKQNRDGSRYFAQAMVTAENFKTANQLIPKLQKSLNEKYLSAQIYVNKLEQGPPFNAPVEIRLYGPNLDILANKGRELRGILATIPQITNTRATLTESTPKAWINLNEEEVLKSGLTPSSIARQIQLALDGKTQGSIVEITQSLPVRVRYPLAHRESVEELENIYLTTQLPSGASDASIPLTAFGDIEIKPTRGSIPRRNGKRINSIEAFIEADLLPADVLKQVTQALAERKFSMPAGYTLEVGGEDEKRDESIGKLLSSIGVIVTLLVLVLVLSFNSFRISLIIALSALQSIGLGLLSIYVFQYPFGFTSIIGLLGLMGLAINAAIVILAELKSHQEAVAGDADAIIAGVMSCGRHITSTTITTVGGFLPLILSGGGFWPPFAIVIAGGTVLTTIISYFFVPSIFMIFARRNRFDMSDGQLVADPKS
jgi:multidrug efflux pump subunit AcrB